MANANTIARVVLGLAAEVGAPVFPSWVGVGVDASITDAGVGVVFPVIDSGVLWGVGVGRMPNGVGTTAVGSAVAETDVGISSEVGA